MLGSHRWTASFPASFVDVLMKMATVTAVSGHLLLTLGRGSHRATRSRTDPGSAVNGPKRVSLLCLSWPSLVRECAVRVDRALRNSKHTGICDVVRRGKLQTPHKSMLNEGKQTGHHGFPPTT